MHSPNSQFVPSETICGENSIPNVPVNDVPDCSSMDLGTSIPPDSSTSTYPVNEELANLNEPSDVGAALSGDVPGMPKKVVNHFIHNIFLYLM